MSPSLPPAVTRFIWLGTLGAVTVVATLSVVIYRTAIDAAVAEQSIEQLAMVRTAAAALQVELESLSSQLRQFNSLPSVQNIDPVLSQRVEAAFGTHSSGVLGFVARADANGRLYYWTPKGELMAKGEQLTPEPGIWAWAADRGNLSQMRMVHGWANSRPHRRALVTPVWRVSPSAETPNPTNEFNGMLAFVLDLNRMVEVFLGPALNELAGDELVVELSTPDFGVRMGPGGAVSPASADGHRHAEPQGTAVIDEADGRRIHAWAKFRAANETWLVASSTRYDLVAGHIRRSSLGQLALTAMLLIALPVAGFLVARRERQAQEEQRRLERQLAESQKMEAIGKLAGGVAHDFNNMLTAILGYAGMIYEDAAPKSPIQDQALQIRRAAESAASLTQKLLAFSRKQVLQANQLDFTTMQDNLLVLVKRVIGENITVTTHAEPDLWPILADPVQVEQSMLNLAINARDAMPNGGMLQITARNAPRPRGERRPDGDVKPGDYVQITVTDTGIGMDDATRARMFEPFFTTKPQGQGTGLGLSTVYGFVRQCGGYIGVLSTPGKGTSVELLLPRASRAADPPTPGRASDGVKRGHETILVVEDEAGVRDLAVQSLRRLGYEVLSAESGDAAMQAAAAHDGVIHLLLSDVVMPGVNGPELARRLRALRPGVRVLFMSGYAADVVTANDLKEAALMAKPFSPGTLARAVRNALDGAPLPSVRATQ